jgi:cbb3-type cytochrome oxidase maturation protein
MPSSIIILIILSAFLGLAAWLIFIWAVKKGQMDDIERPKYRMLDDDPPPAGKYGEKDKDV